jgi:Family of unknown function (DUF6214)
MPEMSKPVPFAEGLANWSPFKMHLEQAEPYSLDLHVVYDGGRFVVDQLTVTRRPGGPPITTEGLREIPIAAMVRTGIENGLMRVGPREYDGRTSSWKLTKAEPIALSERAQAGGGPSDDDLRAVADVYHIAYAVGEPPTKTVMERLGLSRSTASRWIALARKRGLLGPATPRKAGG